MLILRIIDNNTCADYDISDINRIKIGADNKECDVICKHMKSSFSFVEKNGEWQYYENNDYLQPYQINQNVFLDDNEYILAKIFETNDKHIDCDLRKDTAVTVGRKDDRGIRLSGDLFVSKEHAKFINSNGKNYIVEDQNKYKIYVNGIEVSEKQEIKENDVIAIESFYLEIKDGKVRNYVPKDLEKVKTIYSASRVEPIFKRKPRIKIGLETPPEIKFLNPANIGNTPAINWFGTVIMPLALFLISVFVANFINPWFYLMSCISGIISIFSYLSSKGQFKKLAKKREEVYRNYVKKKVEILDNYNRAYAMSLENDNPSPANVIKTGISISQKLWERKREDADFMEVRVGNAEVETSAEIEFPNDELSIFEEPLLEEAKKKIEQLKHIGKIPVTVNLHRNFCTGIIGENRFKLLNRIIAEISGLHAYNDLKIVIFADKKNEANYLWAKWLPHLFNDNKTTRYFIDNLNDAHEKQLELSEIINNNSTGVGETKSSRHAEYLFIIDNAELIEKKQLSSLLGKKTGDSYCSIYLGENIDSFPVSCSCFICSMKEKNTIVYTDGRQKETPFKLDEMDENVLEDYARKLCPIVIEDTFSRSNSIPDKVTFMEGYNAKKLEDLHVEDRWKNNHGYKSLSVPIGVSGGGTLTNFDIHEKANGVHGIVGGTTGSGKTTAVQGWILSLALNYSPEEVNFVLIDFKGESLTKSFTNLPHLAGAISDINKNISKMLVAIKSEVKRRETIISEASNSASGQNINSLNEKALSMGEKCKLPVLIIIIDEYAEFKRQNPDFGETIDSITSKGRSLGIFIIMMSQHPNNLLTANMESNIAFRWCFRVSGRDDSKGFIDTNDAVMISKRNPGRFFVKSKNDLYEEVQSFYCNAPMNGWFMDDEAAENTISRIDLCLNERSNRHLDTTRTITRMGTDEIDEVVDYLNKSAEKLGYRKAEKIWTADIPSMIDIGTMLTDCFDGRLWPEFDGKISIPVGEKDEIANQVTSKLELNFTKNYSVVAFGSPSSGKTTLLQTALLMLSLKYSPRYLGISVVDFGGNNFKRFSSLPHIEIIASRNNEQSIADAFDWLQGEMNERRTLLEDYGSISEYNRKNANKPMKYQMLIADNINYIKNIQKYSDIVKKVLNEGSGMGIYILATSQEKNHTAKIEELFGKKIALLQIDDNSYADLLDRTVKIRPKNFPGRGVVKENVGTEFQIAHWFNKNEKDELSDSIKETVEKMKELPRDNGERTCDLSNTEAYLEAQNNDSILGIQYKNGKAVTIELNDDCQKIILSVHENHLLCAALKHICATNKGNNRTILLNVDPSIEVPKEYFDEVYCDDIEKFALKCNSREKDIVVVNGFLSLNDQSAVKSLITAGTRLRFILIENSARLKKETKENRDCISKILFEDNYLLLGGEIGNHLELQLRANNSSVLSNEEMCIWKRASDYVEFCPIDYLKERGGQT